MDVDYEQTEVYQLWIELKGIIHMVNAAMLPFLIYLVLKKATACHHFTGTFHPNRNWWQQ